MGRYLGRLFTPESVPEPQPQPEQGTAWCCRCDEDREYDVLPGTSSFQIPPWAFCTFCGSLLDIDLEGDAA